MTEGRPLVLVSNRGPVTFDDDGQMSRGTGGLVTALTGLASYRDATWIAGCERCRSHLLSMCADAGFDPRIGYSSDDMVVMQAWVTAGLGVATLVPAALHAADELPGLPAGLGITVVSSALRLGFLASPVVVGAVADGQ